LLRPRATERFIELIHIPFIVGGVHLRIRAVARLAPALRSALKLL